MFYEVSRKVLSTFCKTSMNFFEMFCELFAARPATAQRTAAAGHHPIHLRKPLEQGLANNKKYHHQPEVTKGYYKHVYSPANLLPFRFARRPAHFILECLCIDNPARSHFLDDQQILVARHDVMGFGLHCQREQIIIFFITTNMHIS